MNEEFLWWPAIRDQFKIEFGVEMETRFGGNIANLMYSIHALVDKALASHAPSDQLREAANRLIDYCEDHKWGDMPEPYDSINPLLKLLGREAPSEAAAPPTADDCPQPLHRAGCVALANGPCNCGLEWKVPKIEHNDH